MKVLLERSDGGVSIMDIHEKANLKRNIRKWEQSADGVTVVGWVLKPNVPNDRTYRDAWVRDGEKAKVDFERAKVVVEQRMVNEKRDKMRGLAIREFGGEDVTAEKAQLQNVDPSAARTATTLSDLADLEKQL